jgi:CheY-like chemotaxis protein
MNSLATPILLVEDDANDVLLIQRAFRKASIPRAVHVVEDGERALAYLSGAGPFGDREKYPIPGLVLLDLKLPRKAGLEVLDWVRKHPSALRRLPISMLTSSRQLSDINRAYELGANSYLVKPGEFNALVDLVRSVHHYWFDFSEKPDTVGAP